MLVDGTPRARVLESLLKSAPGRDATVNSAYQMLLRRAPTAAERSAWSARLSRGGDLRTLLASLASSREYYIARAGGSAAGFLAALDEDLLGASAPTAQRPARPGGIDPQARSALARTVILSRRFNDHFLEVSAPSIAGQSSPSEAVIGQVRNALRRPGGFTRAIALLLSTDSARDYYSRLPGANVARPSPSTSGPAGSAQALTIPTHFGYALNFSAVDYASTFSGQPAPTVALPNGLLDPLSDQTSVATETTYELWFNAQSSGALLQIQLQGNNQTFEAPILAVDANGKLTGGLFDVQAGGTLSSGVADSGATIAPTLPETMTSPLTLDYSLNSQANDNQHTYAIVGPNNALVSAATVLDQNWHHAALVVDGNSERLYLDGLLVGAAQTSGVYSRTFVDASGNTYAPTGEGFLGGTITPLAIADAAKPPGVGYPSGFVGSLDDFRVWSTARTAAQIAQSMAAPLPLNPIPQGLIADYDFTPRTELKGPSLTQVAPGGELDNGKPVYFGIDQTGKLYRYDGTSFTTNDDYGDPLTEPPASMLVNTADLNTSLEMLSTAGVVYSVAQDGLSVASSLLDGLPFTTTWLGSTGQSQPWVINGGKIYSFYNPWGINPQWLDEGFSGGSPTSVAPQGRPPFGQPYGGFQNWGAIPLRALATDSSGKLWINVEAGANGPSPWLPVTSNIPNALGQVYAGTDGSVWAIDVQQNVYRMDSVVLDGSSYVCNFVEMATMHGTTWISVASSGDVATITSGLPYEWDVFESVKHYANLVPSSRYGPATNDPAATGTQLSSTEVGSPPSTIPADPFDGVPRIPGYQNFAPYLAIPYSNSAATVDLSGGSNQVEYKVTLNVGDTVLVEVPGGQSASGPFQVDFIGFTTNPTDGTHPVVASYPNLGQVTSDLATIDLVKNNMAAAYPAPMSGTYLIRVTGPAQGNADNADLLLQFSILPGQSNSLLTLMGAQSVQGGNGAVVASYTDPSTAPGATINQLLPTTDPQVAADQALAYQALVAAAVDYVAANYKSESFTDFLNVDTGVNITPQHLFGLQKLADAAVLQNPLKYLKTSSPSQGLLSALQSVLDELNSIDSQRQNVFAFLTVQDSWIQNEINDILGKNTLSTIAQTIVDNQSQDNPPPYLQAPPPSTPYSMAADAAIQGGRQAIGVLSAIVTPLLFAGPLAPVGALLSGLLNIGVAVGATYGSDTLKQSASQMPKLIVPKDKNQIATLVQAASTYQAEIVSGLNARQSLASSPQYYFPLFSNIGLLKALANLNPLVLGSTKADDQLGANNPTAAAVANAAWRALLPSYFKWVPVNSTTESRSQNFDGFYVDASPTTTSEAVNQLLAMQAAGLADFHGSVDTSKIVYSGPDGPADSRTIHYSSYVPTTMASFEAGPAQGASAAHPERFYSLVSAQMTESSKGHDDYLTDEGWFTDNFSFSYSSGQGLYVVGWKLVDANGVEIDPRTSAMVFPTGGAAQPAADGPAVSAFGGGWYFNAAPATPSAGSSLYSTSVNPSEAFLDWFGLSSLVPDTLSGTLNVGGYNNAQPRSEDHIDVANPTYHVVYSPMTSGPGTYSFALIGDSGFERVAVGNGNFTYDPKGSPWIFTGLSGISANGSGFTGSNPSAPEGTQVAVLQETSSYSQTVSGWTPGTYTLTFQAAQRAVEPAQQDFNVLVDSKIVGTFQPDGSSYRSYTTSPFVITTGDHVITFQGVDTAKSDNTVFIDDVVALLS